MSLEGRAARGPRCGMSFRLDAGVLELCADLDILGDHAAVDDLHVTDQALLSFVVVGCAGVPQCLYCAPGQSDHAGANALHAQQANTVKIVFKDFPLDSKCNANVQNGGPHPSACDAAVAVRLAKAKNRDVALGEWFFSNQPQMTGETVRKAALEVGQVADFDAKYAATVEGVKNDIAFGHSLNVSATPTMFINGVKIAGVLAPQYLEAAINLELRRATGQP